MALIAIDYPCANYETHILANVTIFGLVLRRYQGTLSCNGKKKP